MDKEREAFEAWICNQFPGTAKSRLRRHYPNTSNYYDQFTDFAWEGWQARAKQAITLPVKDATGEH